MESIRKHAGVLAYISDELKSDKEFVLAAVQNNGLALEYASEDLKSDKEVVLEAIENNGRAFEYASKDLRPDILDFLSKTQQYGRDLKLLLKYERDLKLRLGLSKDDGEFHGSTCQDYEGGLEYACKDFKSDREIISGFIQNHGRFPGFIGGSLRVRSGVILGLISILFLGWIVKTYVL